MLRLENITKKYGKHTALQNLNLHIEEGTCYGLVGPNGAGKTTAIKIMVGLLFANSGEIFIDGIDIKKNATILKEIIGYVPDTFGIYDTLTVSEYMFFFASTYGITGLRARKRITYLLERVGLLGKESFLVEALSRGMQQRLCVARALIHEPKLLIMDEPASGLDPRTRYEFKEMVLELNAEGTTILLSSHILSELSKMCSDIGIIANGQMVTQGSVKDILKKIEGSNPIKLRILDGVSTAMAIFKENHFVKSISVSGHDILIDFDGNVEEESKLLRELIMAEVAVCEFVREAGSLESFFIQMTNQEPERILLTNYDESSL